MSYALSAKGICEIMDIKGKKMYLAKCHQPPDGCLEGLSDVQIVWKMLRTSHVVIRRRKSKDNRQCNGRK